MPKQYRKPEIILSWPMDPRNQALYGCARGWINVLGENNETPPADCMMPHDGPRVGAWPRVPFWDRVADFGAWKTGVADAVDREMYDEHGIDLRAETVARLTFDAAVAEGWLTRRQCREALQKRRPWEYLRDNMGPRIFNAVADGIEHTIEGTCEKVGMSVAEYERLRADALAREMNPRTSKTLASPARAGATDADLIVAMHYVNECFAGDVTGRPYGQVDVERLKGRWPGIESSFWQSPTASAEPSDYTITMARRPGRRFVTPGQVLWLTWLVKLSRIRCTNKGREFAAACRKIGLPEDKTVRRAWKMIAEQVNKL
ncbi:MAG TPA: hypothetical protein VM425_11715 [Myxococcota bacterium]|nr:hypothetical protein [Myxococcota bacterium]